MDDFDKGEFDKLLRERKTLKREKKALEQQIYQQNFDMGVLLGCLRRMADGIPPIDSELLTLNPMAIHTILQLGTNTGLMHEAYVRNVRNTLRARSHAR